MTMIPEASEMPNRLSISRDPKPTSEIRVWLEKLLGLALVSSLGPLFCILAALYRLALNQPVITIRKCMGRSGKEFNLYKLNTLKSLHPHSSLFRWIRTLGLDELPQLLNIAKGEMAFIGPRPESVEKYMEHPHNSYRRLRLRPGMFGMWQASIGRGGSLRRSWKLDRFYEVRRSMAFDAFVVARTFRRIILDCRRNLRASANDQKTYIHHLEATEGGTLKAVQYLIQCPGKRVAFLLFQRGPGSIGQEFLSLEGVKIIPCSRFMPLRVLQCLLHSMLHFDSNRPSHVHAHSTVSGIICRALRPFFGFEVRYTPHCYAFTYPRKFPGMRLAIKAAEWSLARTPFVGVHVSLHEESLHRKLHARAHTMVIPLPADESQIPIDPAVGFHSRLLLVVGSDRVQKGYGVLEVLQDLMDRKRIGFQIVVLGEGFRNGRVRFCGWQEDVNSFHRKAFCLLNVSFSEGSSLAMIDALNCGLPIIALDIPANRELVLGRGILVAKRNPGAFLSAISGLSANQEMYENLHHEGRQFAQARHSLKDFRRNFSRLYLEAGLPPVVLNSEEKAPGISCSQFKQSGKPDWLAAGTNP